MENIRLYNTTEEYNSDKNNLQKLDYFIGYDTEKDKVYFKPSTSYYILVSTSSDRSANLYKYTDSDGSSTEKIIIPAGSNNYKIDGVIYGFYTTYEGHGQNITSFDLSNFDTSNVTNMGGMFNSCNYLTSLDLSSFDTSKVTNMYRMFNGCNKLNHIKCKQAFKDWCIKNQDTISLPNTMKNGTEGAVGSGANWEIIDYVPEGV